MKDLLYIEKLLLRGKEGKEKVNSEFVKLSPDQINWHPTPNSWSIGQCLDHLIISDSLYFSSFEKIIKNDDMTIWERWNPLSRIFGKMLAYQLQETVKKKVKSPGIFKPSPGPFEAGILDRFNQHHEQLMQYILACKEVDLDSRNITSPVSVAITYNLRNAITILIQHQHRHIHQALRVKENAAFPVATNS